MTTRQVLSNAVPTVIQRRSWDVLWSKSKVVSAMGSSENARRGSKGNAVFRDIGRGFADVPFKVNIGHTHKLTIRRIAHEIRR